MGSCRAHTHGAPQVYAYATGTGRQAGSFEAHLDAVSCLALPQAHADVLVSGSWDATVRTWRYGLGPAATCRTPACKPRCRCRGACSTADLPPHAACS